MKDFSKRFAATDDIKKKSGSSLQFQQVSKLQFILALIALLLIALFFVKQRLDFIRTEKRVRKLRLSHSRLLAEILPLKLEERYLKQFEVVERKAKRDFNLAPPKPSQIKRIVLQKK